MLYTPMAKCEVLLKIARFNNIHSWSRGARAYLQFKCCSKISNVLHSAVYTSCMPSRRLRRLDTPLVWPFLPPSTFNYIGHRIQCITVGGITGLYIIGLYIHTYLIIFPVSWRGGVKNSSHNVQFVLTEPDLHRKHIHLEVIQQGERGYQIKFTLNLRPRDGEETKTGPTCTCCDCHMT